MPQQPELRLGTGFPRARHIAACPRRGLHKFLAAPGTAARSEPVLVARVAFLCVWIHALKLFINKFLNIAIQKNFQIQMVQNDVEISSST